MYRINFVQFIVLLIFLGCIRSASGQHKMDQAQEEVGYFIENAGQFTDFAGNATPFILFKRETPNMDINVTDYGLTFLFKTYVDGQEKQKNINWERIDFILSGASIDSKNIVQEKAANQGEINYYFPQCPNGQQRIIPTKKIIIKAVYPHIDWVLYSTNDGNFKYDFVLHPGANPTDISILYRSRLKPEIDGAGAINIATKYGTLKEANPISFLNNEPISSQFQLKSVYNERFGGYDSEVGFDLDAVSQAAIMSPEAMHELIIDPELVWDTFYGGPVHEGPLSMHKDSNGNLIIVGYGGWTGFPLEDAGTYFLGSWDGATTAAFIVKFNAAGERVWATYYAGIGGGTIFEGIDSDTDNNLFIVAGPMQWIAPYKIMETIFKIWTKVL